MGAICLWSLFLCLACSPRHKTEADKLNKISYAFRYKNLDSTNYYARQALAVSASYSNGRATAINNIAFVNIAKMDYPTAEKQLDSIYSLTDNQLELLIADVQYMRLCQRKAENKSFYDYKLHAQQRIRRINEELDELTDDERQRFLYGETEYHFVSSTYYYYVGLDSLATDALMSVQVDGLMQRDTAQYLNYLYLSGSGGMIHAKTSTETLQKEYDCLLECYLMARKMGYKYWEANSMQAISEQINIPPQRDLLLAANRVSMGYLNPDNMPDTLLAGYLAQRSMEMFRSYGDRYQIAGSLRTLAKCYWAIGDYRSSLLCLETALSDKAIRQTPDLVASISEQMSIVYSSLNDKHNSDVNRNIYLDLQEKTRQDMQLDARASQLERTSTFLNCMIAVIVVVVLLFAYILYRLFKRKTDIFAISESIVSLMERIDDVNQQNISALQEKIEELDEDISVQQLNLDKNKRRNIENRSKVFILTSIRSLIERMQNESQKLQKGDDSEEQKHERLVYITELAQKINEYNGAITQWIQLRQGQINMNIESFPLQSLFDVIKRSSVVSEMQGKKLTVSDTQCCVKADRVLTLFMLNTLVDNARKFTPQGGQISIFAKELTDSVEISVSDTGCGIPADKLSTIFTHKIRNGHGFGLLNCRGILEKYRKQSSIFSVCSISAESSPKGSRFFFRLPKGIIMKLLALLFCINLSAAPSADCRKRLAQQDINTDACLKQADAFADSTYFANVRGNYSQALVYADSARIWLNRHYAHLMPRGTNFMHHLDESSATAPEIEWFRNRLQTNYNIILDIRNESAVAALALHEWALYRYNNEIYTKLFKDVSADTTLAEYCRIMQRSETNKNIAIVLLIISCLALLGVIYLTYYRRTVKNNSLKEVYEQLEDIVLSAASAEQKLQEARQLANGEKAKDNGVDISSVIKKLIEATEEEAALKVEALNKGELLRRTIYEKDRFYVSNNIIENCLSTIKHETMYYPSKIYNSITPYTTAQDSTSAVEISDAADVKLDLQSLGNLIAYYSELYTILLEQVYGQTRSVRFKCNPVALSKFVRSGNDSLTTLADADLIAFMFTLLKRYNGGEVPQYEAAENGAYITITVTMGSQCKGNTAAESRESQVDIFAPCSDNVPILIIRQILRETSAATNLCACGIIVVGQAPLTLRLTLPSFVNKRFTNPA